MFLAVATSFVQVQPLASHLSLDICRIIFTPFQENVIVNTLKYSVKNSLYIGWVCFSFPYLQGELLTKKYLKKSLLELTVYQAQPKLGFRDIKIWKIKFLSLRHLICVDRHENKQLNMVKICIGAKTSGRKASEKKENL